jgi:hypothetical protein
MVFDTSVAMNLLLFMALFPMAFIWLRRTWRIIIKRDFSEVALKRGESPEQPEKYAPYTAAVNLIGGALAVFVIFSVLLFQMHFDTWSAIAGSTLWLKIFADFGISRQAHLADELRKKKAEAAE